MSNTMSITRKEYSLNKVILQNKINSIPFTALICEGTKVYSYEKLNKWWRSQSWILQNVQNYRSQEKHFGDPFLISVIPIGMYENDFFTTRLYPKLKAFTI